MEENIRLKISILLAPPIYTRPAQYKGWDVPQVLLSGDSKNIDQWREDQAIEQTKIRRPELWSKHQQEE